MMRGQKNLDVENSPSISLTEALGGRERTHVHYTGMVYKVVCKPVIPVVMAG